MVQASSGKTPNPKSKPVSNLRPDFKSPKNVFHIGGTPVEFPYQPYGSQLAFMGRVISTLDRAQKDGHCHALLESPTGTGKSLSLLCSTIAWQQNYKPKAHSLTPSQSKPAPEAYTDPLNHGGGFVPEVEPSGQANSETIQPAPDSKAKKKLMPTIYYSSRTHSQISQVIREYRKTTYRVPMAVLASRKHYCTNPQLRGKENIDEDCKMLLRNREAGCSKFKNANKVKAHPSLQKGGCHEAHDIEDLVKVGQVVKGCSYYAARSMADDAQLVFCPYNYIINPVIRGAMDVDIKGAILIFDEAHNIEDIARDAGSVDLEEGILDKLHSELQELCPNDALIYQPLCEMAQDLISWIERRKGTLEKREFQHYVSCWTGDKAIRELREANITQQCFPILLECATKAIRAATDLESDAPHLSGLSVITLEGLFSALTYFFSRAGSHIFDYQLAIQRYIKRDARVGVGYPTHCLSLWCLNPAVVFREIADLSLSVILTSGTLSPMNSFSTELGVQFTTCLEAPHVIDVKSQVWAGIISSGPENYPLNASYKTADGYAFQDALGKSLEGILKIVPGGSLVFFPSYKLMDKLCCRWRETGQWSQLSALKSLFIEPRGGSQEDFEPVLKGYYNSVRGGNRPAFSRKKKMTKTDLGPPRKMCQPGEFKKDGAAFFAVCRGKVSEGIDFSDNNARAVIIVGIPFPNVNDIQVGLKKKYNDTFKSSKNLLSGSEWYCQQAFRALNQAAGRCIRHMFDYGAIIFLDERYREQRSRENISKWLRKSIQLYDTYGSSLESLKSFFSNVKERVNSINGNEVDTSSINEEVSTCLKENKVIPMKKTGIRSAQSVEKTELNSKGKDILVLEAWKRLKSAAKDNSSQKQCKNLECGSRNVPRCSTVLPNTIEDDSDPCVVQETPGVYGNFNSPSLVSHCKDENSSSTIIEGSTGFSDQWSPHSMSIDPSRGPSVVQCSSITSPGGEMPTGPYHMNPEVEASLNLSVNSHMQKRRRFTISPVIDIEDEESNDFDDKYMKKPMAGRDLSRRIEFSENDDVQIEQAPNIHLRSLLKNIAALSASSVPTAGKRLQISCSLCRSPLGLGLPHDNLCITGLLSSLFKVHSPTSLEGETKPGQMNKPTSIPVIITDMSLVDPQLFKSTPSVAHQESNWSEDGCVFKNIFCPFCVSPGNSLGVQIMKTDTSNVQLLDKVLFYADHLEVQNPEALKDSLPKEKDSLQMTANQNDALKAIEKFTYTAKKEKCGGWRTTKSKLRLPRGVVLSREND